MADIYLHAERDEIVDPKNFSGLSLVAFLLSLVGAFSLLYYQLLPVALIAVALGVVVLKIAPTSYLSGFSKFLAMAAIAIGTTSAATGQFGRMLQTNSDLVYAKQVAMESLQLTAEGNGVEVMKLMGISEEEQGKSVDIENKDLFDPTQRAKDRFRTSRAFVDIPNRKTKPEWKFIGLTAEFQIDNTYYYRLQYQDTAQAIPANYWVTVRKDAPLYGPTTAPQNKGKKLSEKELTVNWYLDRLEEVTSKELNN